jgi:hypothetical protein
MLTSSKILQKSVVKSGTSEDLKMSQVCKTTVSRISGLQQ